ncbi:MAG: integrase [Gammaproteobacteria bacterium]
MSTMIREIYEALKAAGVPDEQASAAAEAVAPKGEVATKTDIADDLRTEFAALRTDFAVLRGEVWMVGFNLAISVPLLWKVFAP